MKFNKLLTRQHSFPSLIIHPHFLGATIIAVIVLLLLLVGCSTYNPKKFHSKNYDDCDVLLKKRYSHTRFARQPKMSNTHSANKKSRQVAKKVDFESKSVLQDSISPLTEISTSEMLAEADPIKVAGKDNVTIAKDSEERIQRTHDSKVLSELPKPASVYSRQNDHPNSLLFYGLNLGGPCLLSLILLSAFTPTSMRISAWGAHHPIASKVIIGGIQTGTALGGLMAGNYLGDHHLFVPGELIASAAGAAIGSSILYPKAKKVLNRFSATYLKQKFCDVVMFSAGAVMFLTAGNKLSASGPNVKPEINQTISDYRTAYYDKQTSEIIRDKESQGDPVEKKDGKGGMIFLASLLFTVGILAVAAISCNLSCSGAGTGALAVAVLGGGALIAGYVAWLKNINKKYKVKRKTDGAVTSNRKTATFGK